MGRLLELGRMMWIASTLFHGLIKMLRVSIKIDMKVLSPAKSTSKFNSVMEVIPMTMIILFLVFTSTFYACLKSYKMDSRLWEVDFSWAQAQLEF